MASRNSIMAAGADGWMFRNRVINGTFRIDQRFEGATTATVAGGGNYTCDRWAMSASQASKVSFTAINPAFYNSGITTCILLQSPSSAYTSTSSDYFQFYQTIEGSNITDLGFGYANAKQVTVSFYALASVGGTYSFRLCNGNASLSYVQTFNLVANQLTYLTFTILGPTSGTWNITPASAGLQLNFDLGSGTNYQTSTLSTWISGNYSTAPGCVSLVGNASASLYVAQVQLEVGTVATPFENRPYGLELVLCQRYFEKSYNPGYKPGDTSQSYSQADFFYITGLASQANVLYKSYYYKVTKMATPALVVYSPTTGASSKVRDNTNGNDIGVSIVSNGVTQMSIYATTGSGATTGYTAHWTAAAEL